MTDATRRALRTAYQALLALAVVIPAVAAILPSFDLPSDWIAVALAGAAAAAAVSRILNGLEDVGLIPAWLKGEKSTGSETPGAVDAPRPADVPQEG